MLWVPGGQSGQEIWALGWCSPAVLPPGNAKPASEAAPSEHNANPSLSLSLPGREKLVTLASLVLQDHRERRYRARLHSPAPGSEVQ